MAADVRLDVLYEVPSLLKEGVVVYSITGKKVIYANAKAQDLIGLRENAGAHDISSLVERINPEDRGYITSQYDEILKKSTITDVEFRLRGAGKEMFICFDAYVLSDGSSIIILIQDISKTKQYERYLVEFGGRKNTVLDTLTHHISGALNLMKHLASEAEKNIDGSNTNHVKTYVKLLNENSHRCIEIINELMKEEHVQSPNISLKKTRVDIVSTIKMIYEEFRQSYLDRQFHLDSSAESIYVSLDDVKLLQVVNNFISNSIKYTHAHQPITIQIIDAQTEVTVSVEDNGIGIPDELKPLIFERHRGNGRPGLNGEKSIGLGLWICKTLIEMMDGKIGFESTEGKGSRFYFSLPKE